MKTRATRNLSKSWPDLFQRESLVTVDRHKYRRHRVRSMNETSDIYIHLYVYVCVYMHENDSAVFIAACTHIYMYNLHNMYNIFINYLLITICKDWARAMKDPFFYAVMRVRCKLFPLHARNDHADFLEFHSKIALTSCPFVKWCEKPYCTRVSAIYFIK